MNPQLEPAGGVSTGSQGRHTLELDFNFAVSHRPLCEIDQLVTHDGALLCLEDELPCGRKQNPLNTDCFRKTLLPMTVEKIEGVEKIDIPGSLGKRQPENAVLVGIEHPPRAGSHQAATPGQFDLGLFQEGMVIPPGANSQGSMGKTSAIGPQQPERNSRSPAQVDLEVSAQQDRIGSFRGHLDLCPAAARVLPAVKNADPCCVVRMGNLDMGKEAGIFRFNQRKIEGAIPGASVKDCAQG